MEIRINDHSTHLADRLPVEEGCRRGTPDPWFNPPVTSTKGAVPAAYRRPA